MGPACAGAARIARAPAISLACSRAAFVEALVDAAAADNPPFVLDYVRLDLEAVKPGETIHE